MKILSIKGYAKKDIQVIKTKMRIHYVHVPKYACQTSSK